MSVVMQAPAGLTSLTISSGTTYVANSLGQINAQNSDVAALLGFGFSAVSGPAQFQANPRNLLDGGDFSVNPAQRNIAGLASGGTLSTPITNAATYFADRWFAVGGASSSIFMALVADTSIQGFSQSLKLARTAANANTAAINFGQALLTEDSIRAQGQQVTFSFWAKQGANYSGGALSVAVISGTGTNQSAASMVAATWTNQASSVSGSQSLTTAMTRYSFTGNIPANATQLGVLLTWTPSGTAGADDSITVNGLQLEIGNMSAFEHMDAQVVLELMQQFAWVVAEPAAGTPVANGMNTSSTAQQFILPPPGQFWKAPSLTVSAGSFKTNQAGTATSTTLTAGTLHAPSSIMAIANSAGTGGQATQLQGGGGSGYILASADL